MHDPSKPSADVVVVGAGVIGLAIAWRAAARGLRTLVLERGRAGGGTSSFAAGMLAPISEADPSEQPLLDLGMASARAYPGFIAQLREASVLDPGYLGCGTLSVARDADEAVSLERAHQLRRRLGLRAERLRPSAARRMEPALAPTLRLALEYPDDHVIDPRALTRALDDAARRAGAEVREGFEVGSVVCEAGSVRGVASASGETVPAERVVIAAGVWAGSLAGLPEAARMPLRPVKGQILRLHDPAGPGLLSHVLRYDGGYVAPRADGRYVIGATMEERGFDDTVTAGAVFELLRDAEELLPGISELVIDEVGAGLRPGTPDNTPIVGSSSVVDGLVWAIGHYRNGILLAPLTAELVAAELLGSAPEATVEGVTLDAWSPGRFERAAAAAAR